MRYCLGQLISWCCYLKRVLTNRGGQVTGGGGRPEVWGHSLLRARVTGSLGGVLPVKSAAELIQLIGKGGVFACSCRFFFVRDLLKALHTHRHAHTHAHACTCIRARAHTHTHVHNTTHTYAPTHEPPPSPSTASIRQQI